MRRPPSSDPDVATDWFAERGGEQRQAHKGAALRQWADEVLRQLPAGRVAVVSASVEGCALAAVVAALRSEPTTWEQLALGRPQPRREGTVVVVEPVRLAPGFLQALQRVLPGVEVIEGLAASARLAPAA